MFRRSLPSTDLHFQYYVINSNHSRPLRLVQVQVCLLLMDRTSQYTSAIDFLEKLLCEIICCVRLLTHSDTVSYALDFTITTV